MQEPPRPTTNRKIQGDDLGDNLANSLIEDFDSNDTDSAEESTDLRMGSRNHEAWIDAIGPEDADPEEIMDELETYGFDQVDDGTYISNPTMPSDMPETWHDADDDADRNFAISELGEDDRRFRQVDYENRPVEDEVAGDFEDPEWDEYESDEDEI